MGGSVLLSLYRSLARHRLFAILNIGGLALGIAVFLVLYLFVRFETGYDKTIPGWDKIWVAQRTLQFPGAPRVQIPTRPDMLAQLKADFPGVRGTRLLAGEVSLQSGQNATEVRLAQVDPDYFGYFPAVPLQGDPAVALRDPEGAVITQRVARDHLPPGSPIGQILHVTIGDKPHRYVVRAVIADPPANLTHRNDVIVRLLPTADMFFAKQDQSGLVTFLQLRDAAAARVLQTALPAFNRRHPDPNFTGPAGKIDLTATIVPLASLHLAEPRDRVIVIALGAVGLIALLLAAINYVNLATARADIRAREVAVRKVVGASRAALVRQFIGEALVATAIAALIAIALVEITLPLVNLVGGSVLTIDYLGRDTILVPLVMVVVIVGVLAGAYPAMVLSRYRPAAVLAAAQSPGGGRGGRRLRQLLVVGQFAVGIAMMVGTGVLFIQAHHLRSADLGFRRDGLIQVQSYASPALDEAQRAELLRRIAALPTVADTGLSSAAVGSGSYGLGNMEWPGGPSPTPNIVQVDTGEGFFSVYGARLLAGRWFDSGRFALDLTPKSDEAAADRETHVILNRTVVRTLGFANPAAAIGQSLRMSDRPRIVVIGVVDDLRFGSPEVPIDPSAYYLRKAPFAPILSLRIRETDAAPTLAAVDRLWHATAPQVPFVAQTVERTLYDEYYKQDAQRAALFTIGAVLAVVIACLGLYGLAAFDTARRIKEIGIRKALGASTRDVLRLLVGQFVRPVLVANLIAWPIAYVAMSRWLGGFDDRIALSPSFFLAASVVALAIAILTVIGQAWRVARAEPAIALRHS
jgi:hypothetical protein